MTKREFVADYTPNTETACDMCEGRGWQWGLVDKKTGAHFYGTTAVLSDAEYEQGQRYMQRHGKRVKQPCGTCGGSGIMPEYLKPGYWEARMGR